MKIKQIILILLCLFIVSCSSKPNEVDSYEDILDSIEKPKNLELSIEGSYKLEDMEPLAEPTEDIRNKYKNTPDLYIAENFIKFGEIYSFNPSFKSRYLDFSNIIKPSNSNIDSLIKEKSGPVYTISDGQFIYQNVLVLENKRLAMVSDGILFTFKKYSEKVDEAIIKENIKLSDTNNPKEDGNRKQEQAAAFIAIKTPEKDSDTNNYFNYYTILIHRDENNNYSAYAIKDIFIPGKNEVKIAGMEHKTEDELKDVFFMGPLLADDEQINYYDLGDGEANQILYIDEEYVCIETKKYDSISRKYRLYNEQRLGEDKSLSVTDIAGEAGLESFIDSTARTINKNNIEASTIDMVDIYNLGLARNKGKWNFKSNLIVHEDEKIIVTDYMVDIVPNIDIAEEELNIAWDQIQNKFPSLKDAFNSPNADMLVVQKPQELIVSPIKDGIIADDYALSISIGELDKIIMTQWVKGPKVQDLVKQFLDQEKVILRTMK